MVGGGIGSVMGPLHLAGATLGRRVKLVSGCFSSDPQKSKIAGTQYGVHRNRIYKSYEEMIQHESELPESERIHFLCVATPTHLHYSICLFALEHGFHVMCESPLCSTEEEALRLLEVSREKNLLIAISNPYNSFSMVRYARDLIANNALGDIVSLRVHYLQNAGILERDLSWKSGVSCFSDLGLQAFHLARFVSQQTCSRVSACLARSFGMRTTDDAGSAVLQLKEGAFCQLSVSKMALLHDNDVQIEVDGTVGCLHWDLAHSSQLVFQRLHMNRQVLTPESVPVVDHLRMRYSRLPFGHAEGFTEAMANMYDGFLNAIEMREHKESQMLMRDYTSITDGIEGILFLNRAVESSQRGSIWTDIPTTPLYDASTSSTTAFPGVGSGGQTMSSGECVQVF